MTLTPTADAVSPPVGGDLHLAAEAIIVRFDGLIAIDQVSLDLVQDEVLGLIGPNGAGKTTLVNCLTGFQRPTSGRVLLGGAQISGATPQRVRRSGVARTFQGGRLYKDMTVWDNVEVTALALGHPRHEAAQMTERAIASLGLEQIARKKAGSLPYTDERRVGIARAVVAYPKFLLLDEPAAGMSDHECDELIAIIARLRRDISCGILLIEHNMHVITALCSRLHVLDGGRTLALGNPDELLRSPQVRNAYLGAED
jgi:branched-chain amino acid transport system ATP-binding protein